MMRDVTNTNRGTPVYPSHKILAAKRRCCPEPSAITVMETSAEVELQHLLDHVSSRLLQITRDDLLKLVFFTSTVPLQLSVVNETKEEIVVWKNPRPSSSRFCRPIRLQFFKESADSSRKELEYMEKNQFSRHVQ